MKIGDMVLIKGNFQVRNASKVHWPECYGQFGMVIDHANRLHVPAVKVMVLGDVVEFDIDELEVISEEG
jgi:hypothetical protein